MVGAGRQCRGLIEAHRHVRPIDRVTIWSRTPAHAERAAAECVRDGIPARRDGRSRGRRSRRRHRVVRDAVDAAARPRPTGSSPGMHLDLVGAFKRTCARPTMRSCSARDLIVVDDREGALAEGGDVVQAIASGAISDTDIAAELARLRARRRIPAARATTRSPCSSRSASRSRTSRRRRPSSPMTHRRPATGSLPSTSPVCGAGISGSCRSMSSAFRRRRSSSAP